MWSASKGSQEGGVCHEAYPTVVAMVARCRVDYVHVLIKDSTVTGAQLFQHSSCLPWQCLFGCGNWRRSAINQL